MKHVIIRRYLGGFDTVQSDARLTSKPVSTLGRRITRDPSSRPFSSKVPSLSCLRTQNSISIRESNNTDASSYRHISVICLTIEAWRLDLKRSPIAMQQAYSIFRHLKFLRNQLLEVFHCIFRVQTDGEITTRGSLYIQRYVRGLGRATPVYLCSRRAFHDFFINYTRICYITLFEAHTNYLKLDSYFIAG